jgi:hypothetical protein
MINYATIALSGVNNVTLSSDKKESFCVDCFNIYSVICRCMSWIVCCVNILAKSFYWAIDCSFETQNGFLKN